MDTEKGQDMLDAGPTEYTATEIAVETASSRMPEITRPEPDEGDPALLEEIYASIRTVRDPEIPVNLLDLGLIYEVMVRKDGIVYIEMTLTTPSCPVAGSLPGQVQHTASLVPGVSVVLLKLVWEPAWTPDRMSEAAKLELGLL
jgi:FeS assembly SUF system protein